MIAVINVEYTGAEASCIIEVDGTAGTITASIGDAGAESPDPNFGDTGVIDIAETAYDTVGEIVEAIDGYDDYTASLASGLSGYSADSLTDQYFQAKGYIASIAVTVDSILSSSALITWEKAQAILDLEASEQTMTEYFINFASSEAERLTGRTLKANDYTAYLPGTGKATIITPQYPINSVTTLKIDSGRDFGSNTEYTENTDFDVDTESGIIYLFDATFPDIRRSVYLEYNAGFSTVPEDLQFAVIDVVAWNYKRYPGKGIGIRKVQSPDGMQTEMEITIPLSAQRIFDRYIDRRR